MNRMGKLTLLALPLVIMTVGLYGVKWKRENPTPAALDLEVRRVLLKSNNGEISSGLSSQKYILSSEEAEAIISHVWLTTPKRFHSLGQVKEKDTVFSLGAGNIVVGAGIADDQYIGIGFRGEPRCYRLHPATSRYLRRWLAEHPQVTKQIGVK